MTTPGHAIGEVILMSHASAYFNLEKVDGKHNVKVLQKDLNTLPGVMSVSVNSHSGSLAVDYDTTGVTHAQIQRKIEGLGFSIDSFSIDQLTE
ncbi:conserved hypothetical protein [uncultured Eubacteriales bacterium]|uniref:HMA domain-containing protein n=1 Tax=uncultured Eubacteriales bacterium TaxID=172733 RepID=A0A212JB78_9FIRM|nr:conserved hypothetical protein [uncultured Eubacteriales bacterium]